MDDEGIQQLIDHFNQEQKNLKKVLIQQAMWAKEHISLMEIYSLPPQERKIVSDVIKEYYDELKSMFEKIQHSSDEMISQHNDYLDNIEYELEETLGCEIDEETLQQQTELPHRPLSQDYRRFVAQRQDSFHFGLPDCL